MGMFDYVRCEVPLPDGWAADELQTKDFDCELVTHVITKEGRLMLERIDSTEFVPKEERPYPTEDGLMGMCGMLRCTKSLHDSSFHGVVNFYGSETLGYEPPQPGDQFRRPIYKSHDYHAKFTDGQLVSIETVQD
jgi:hypothetical protein